MFWKVGRVVPIIGLLVLGVRGSQTIFDAKPAAGLSTPPVNATAIQALSALSEEYSTVHHPAFPSYSVRIRKTASTWCDDTASSYTGYIDTSEARHIFFYFFESRSNPDKDDVIFWTNGGPGCSSSLGLFMELGPCRIVDGKTERNEYSWNEKANIFFIDQPIGVGFSYAEYGEAVSTTDEGAVDIAAFVAIFFSTFTKFQGRAFHMAGESYGGRYIPVYASAIYEQNKKLKAHGLEPINLKSVIIGNGMTDPPRMVSSYYDIQCTTASVEPFHSISTCVRMKTILPRCEKMIKESCDDTFDAIGCQAGMSFCQNELMIPLLAIGRNPYDISRDCDGSLSETLCYPVTNSIAQYLNLPETRELLGVSPALDNTTVSSCSNAVGAAFSQTMDLVKDHIEFYLEGLLDRGVKALIYAGSYDYICNWVGNRRMVDALKWSSSEEFSQKDLQSWSVVKGQESISGAGLVKSVGGLTFLTVAGAGHMVPYDKPVEALEMVNRWLADESF